MQTHDPSCGKLAKHALALLWDLVNLSGQVIAGEPTSSTVYCVSTQEHQEPESSWLVSRVTSTQKQVSSDQVARRIKAPKRCSTRGVYI